MVKKVVSLNDKVAHLVPVVPSTDWEQLLTDWLNLKQSAHTIRVYAADIRNFLMSHDGLTLSKFLTGDRHWAYELVNRYKGNLIQSRLKAATINRRLAAIKSLVSYAYACGKCDYTLETVKGEQLKAYRDTTGIDADAFRRMLGLCDLTTVAGKRDYALLVLLWGNALRRSEVARTKIGDFDPSAGTLRIYGKGKGTEAQLVTLGKGAIAALSDWLAARGESNSDAALFCSVNKGYKKGRLTPDGIYKIVRKIATEAGITKIVSPHRIRHSSITAALDATAGDVRKVQKLSRHANLNTLMIYDDNRINHQGEVTQLLDDLI
jgi:integrase/recombinase XerC